MKLINNNGIVEAHIPKNELIPKGLEKLGIMAPMLCYVLPLWIAAFFWNKPIKIVVDDIPEPYGASLEEC